MTSQRLLSRLAALALLAGVGARTAAAPVSGDVAEATGWRAEVVVQGLSHPWSIAWLPDGSALVTERSGRLRVIRDGRLDPTPVSGLPPRRRRASNPCPPGCIAASSGWEIWRNLAGNLLPALVGLHGKFEPNFKNALTFLNCASK